MGSFEAAVFGGIGGGVLAVLFFVGMGIWLSSKYSQSAEEEYHQPDGMRHQDMARWVASIDISVPPLEQPPVLSASGTPLATSQPPSRTVPSPALSDPSIRSPSSHHSASQSHLDTTVIRKEDTRPPQPASSAKGNESSDWKREKGTMEPAGQNS